MHKKEKNPVGRPKKIENGANHTFFIPNELWEAIDPMKTGKGRTAFLSEALKEKLAKGKSKSDSQIEAIKQLLNQ